jgi:hypothetical protein
MYERLIWVLWPSFIMGGIAEMFFFALIDPHDLAFHGEPLMWSRMAVYSVGFFVFWAFAAGSSALTCFLQRSPFEVNRCPLPVGDRPFGCPKRDDPNACCD